MIGQAFEAIVAAADVESWWKEAQIRWFGASVTALALLDLGPCLTRSGRHNIDISTMPERPYLQMPTHVD